MSAAGRQEGSAVGGGQPIDRGSWPPEGPRRRFVEFLDKVRLDNGTKSLRVTARATNLTSPSRISELLHGRALPANEVQAKALVRALSGGDDDAERGLRLYRLARSADDARPARRVSGHRARELAVLRAEAGARREARLKAAAVPASKIDALIAWMDALEVPDMSVPAGGLRVLVGPMGAGKTELAHRWFVRGLDAAREDPSAGVPVWLDARRAVP